MVDLRTATKFRRMVLFACVFVVAVQMTFSYPTGEKLRHKKGREKDLSLDYNEVDFQQPWGVVEMKPVPRHTFEKEIKKANNYRDFVRIFYGRDLPDKIVDEILTARPYDAEAAARFKMDHGHTFYSDYGSSNILSGEDPVSHWNEINANKWAECREPRPEVIHLHDKIDSGSNQIFYPSCTIVHRCRRHYGCCDDTSICVPKSIQRISRRFFVMHVTLDHRLQLRQDNFFETTTFENHTECECQRKEALWKNRCSECPFPFMLTHQAPHCTCDCHEKDERCWKTKRGDIAFEEKALQCIKEEACQIPKCEHGEFDMKSLRSGYCPKGDLEHHRHSEGIGTGEGYLENLEELMESEADDIWVDSDDDYSGFDTDHYGGS